MGSLKVWNGTTSQWEYTGGGFLPSVNPGTCCMRTANAVQSIPDSTFQTLTLTVVSYSNNVDTTVANTIKVITPGFYVLTGSMTFDNTGPTTGSRRVLAIYVNGAQTGRSEVRAMDNAEFFTGDVAIQQYLNAGDLVTLNAWQNSAAGLNTMSSYYPRLSVSLISNQGPQGIQGLQGVQGAKGDPASLPQINAYTTVGNSTWTKPANAVRVEVIAIGGGAGGGSGRRGAALSIRAGGGGGAGGQVSTGTFTASDLGATENVTVGAGGAGGIAQATDDTNGLIGAVGVASYFGSAATNRWVGTNAPAAGAAGGVAAAAGGVAAAPGGSTGAASSATGAVGTTSNNQLGRGTSWSAGAGGGGGGCTAADVASAGGTGGPGVSGSSTAPAGGTLGGGAGAAGQAARTGSYRAGDGGGGGGGSITTAAGKGGDGGSPGGGGGGGGAALNGFASGAGGKGGDGAVYVITYF